MESERGRRQQVECEVKAGSPIGAGLDLELRPDRLDQAASDRQTEARTGEAVVSRPAAGASERVVQAGHGVRIDAVAGVAHRKLDAAWPPGLSHDLHKPVFGKLESVGR